MSGEEKEKKCLINVGYFANHPNISNEFHLKKEILEEEIKTNEILEEETKTN